MILSPKKNPIKEAIKEFPSITDKEKVRLLNGIKGLGTSQISFLNSLHHGDKITYTSEDGYWYTKEVIFFHFSEVGDKAALIGFLPDERSIKYCAGNYLNGIKPIIYLDKMRLEKLL
jgi:hypothetical protein